MKKKKEVQFEQPSEVLLIINRYILIILAIIVLGILVAGYFFLLRPKIEEIQQVEVETSETQEIKLQNENLLTRIKELEAEYQDILNNRTDDLDTLKKILPEEPYIAELFVLANSLAADMNFELSEIDISEDISEKNSDQGTRAAVPNIEDENVPLEASLEVVDRPDKESVKSLVVHLAITRAYPSEEADGEEAVAEAEEWGSVYDDFKQYVATLENHLRLMDVQAINFSELRQEPGGVSSFNIDLITYHR